MPNVALCGLLVLSKPNISSYLLSDISELSVSYQLGVGSDWLWSLAAAIMWLYAQLWLCNLSTCDIAYIALKSLIQITVS